MTNMTPDDDGVFDLTGLAGLYALDALEGEDLVRFEEALERDPALRDEVASYRETATRLSELSATEPPADLRNRVLAEVAATRQDAPVVRLDRRSPASGVRRMLTVAAAAAVVLLAMFGGYLLAERDGAADTELAGLLARPDTSVVPLTGAAAVDAGGSLVISPSTNTVVVVTDSLERPAAGRTYELWRIDGRGVHPVGLFEPDREGKVQVALDVPLDGVTGFAVTDEPDGGSRQATTPILVQAAVA